MEAAEPIFSRKPAAYRVYVLENRDGRFYVGVTDNVVHTVGQYDCSSDEWTKDRGPWSVVWQSQELTLTEARKLENRLKRQGRGKGFYTITGLQDRDRKSVV